MSRETLPNIPLDSDDWTQLSAEAGYFIQCLWGDCAIAISATKSTLDASGIGVWLKSGDNFSNNAGGTAWGRRRGSPSCMVSVTEGASEGGAMGGMM